MKFNYKDDTEAFLSALDFSMFFQVGDGEEPLLKDFDAQLASWKAMAKSEYVEGNMSEEDYNRKMAAFRVLRSNKARELKGKNQIKRRYAESPADFEMIYQRELVNETIPDGEVFRKHLTDKVTELLEHQNGLPTKERVLKLQELADHFLKWLKGKTHGKPNELIAPAVALFCKAISETEIMRKGETEGVETYCKRVCGQYNLPYTDRVRQNFHNRGTAKHKEMIIENILPNVPEIIQNKLLLYLEGDTGLYG